MRPSDPRRPPFSRRTEWPRETNPWSVAVEQARSLGREFIDLSDANISRLMPPLNPELIQRALSDSSVLRYEPSAFGCDGARRVIASYYQRRGLEICAENILLMASTSEAYGHLFRLLADPGDEILVPTPSYPLFDHLADLADLKLVPYALGYDGTWHLPSGNIEARVTERTRAIILVSPNNPTGSVFDRAERARVITLARDRGLALISDEVFADYTLGPESHETASLIGQPNVLCFSLNGLSKSAGLPQIKAGWIAVSGPSEFVDEATARLEIVLDAHLSVSAPAQAVLSTVLPGIDPWQESLRGRIAENRAQLDRALAGSPARRRHSAGGWSAIVELPALRGDEAWALQLLEGHEILGQPGYLFDLVGRPCLVLSLILPPETFQEGVRRLAEGVVAGSS